MWISRRNKSVKGKEKEAIYIPKVQEGKEEIILSAVCVTWSLVLYLCFVDRCLSFCTFSFGRCVVCSSSIYGFWLPHWYLQTLLTRRIQRIKQSEGRKEQVEKEELISIIKHEGTIVGIDYYSSFLISRFSDVLHTYEGNTSPLSIAVEKCHFNIVKPILENSSYIDLSDIGKSPLFLAAEKGYHAILVLLLHS